MKQGHVVGTKKEKKGASDWYKQIEEENIRKIEGPGKQSSRRVSRSEPLGGDTLLAALGSPTYASTQEMIVSTTVAEIAPVAPYPFTPPSCRRKHKPVVPSIPRCMHGSVPR